MSGIVKGTAFALDLTLFKGQAAVVAPTLEAGDVLIAGVDGTVDMPPFLPIASLPAVTPVGSKNVQIQVSTAESNFDRIKIELHDPDDQWDDVAYEIRPDLIGDGTVGSGAEHVELVVRYTDGNPIAGAAVWITTGDDPESGVVAGPQITDAFGRVTFLLDPGVGYRRWTQLSAHEFVNPQIFDVE